MQLIRKRLCLYDDDIHPKKPAFNCNGDEIFLIKCNISLQLLAVGSPNYGKHFLTRPTYFRPHLHHHHLSPQSAFYLFIFNERVMHFATFNEHTAKFPHFFPLSLKLHASHQTLILIDKLSFKTFQEEATEKNPPVFIIAA